jgi:predicted nucleic acid-binding protein
MLNALTRAARRGRTDQPANKLFLNSLLSYNIQVESLTMEDQWAECRPLILKHRLSAYDSAYLAMAKRLKLPLATLDEQLRLAAKSEGLFHLG